MGYGVWGMEVFVHPMPHTPYPALLVSRDQRLNFPRHRAMTPTVGLASLWYPTVRSSPLSGRPAQGP